MKTFTRISSVLTLALAVCWGSLRAQETCETAVAVDCNSQTFGSTAGVANDTGTSGAGLCVTAVGTGGQQWYTFTAPADGSVIMSLVSANTTFDTKIHVYTGACGALDCVTGNDDFVGLQSQVTFDIVGGTTYIIRVGGFGAAEGAFELNITCDLVTDGCTDILACNYSDLAINDDGSCCFGDCSTVTVGGGAFTGEVSWELYDPIGNLIAAGGAPYNEIVCIPSPDCNYSLVMIDDFGDGWNGNIFTLTNSNGDVEATATLGDGTGPEAVTLALGGLVSGCTDNLASNYNPSADCDNGTCVTCTGGSQVMNINMADTGGDGWNGAVWLLLDETFATVATGSLDGGVEGLQVECVLPGCYTMTVTGGTFPDEVSWSITDVSNNVIISGGAGASAGFPWAGQVGCVIPGCTDSNCNNYNEFATEDDGSCICPPVNDDCANATAIGCGQTIDGSTINANADGTLDACSGIAVTSPGVWYTFIGTGDQVQLSTCNSAGGDTKIHVFVGDCGNPVCVAGNDDGCDAGFLSSITFTTVVGFAYYALVSEFGAGNGLDFTLDMTCVDCDGTAINDECVNALPLPTGVDFPGNLCCSNPDGDMSAWAGFGTEYGIWYVINSGDFDALSINFWNGLGEGPDAEDGTDVGIGMFDGTDGCDALAPLVGGIGFDGNPLDGFIFNSYEFGLVIQPNTDYYFCLTTSDPINCGSFVLNVTLSNVGCTDPLATNFCIDCDIDDGSCEYLTGPANDLCEDAITLDCNTTVSGTTGGSTNTGAPTVCSVGAGDQGVWYTFVGDGQFVSLSTCGAQIDSRISVVSSADACVGPFTCVDSEDNDATDAGCGFFNGDDASISFVSVPGTVYYVYITAGATDTDGDGINDLTDGGFDLSFSCDPVVNGCLDECACNFDPTANVDDASCDFFSCAGCGVGSVAVMMDMGDTFGDGWNGNTYSIEDLSGTVVASGDLDDAQCGDGTDVGFDVFCLADGCYTMTVGGGGFPGEVFWSLDDSEGNNIANGPAGTGTGTFSFTIGGGECGCTDAGACNFNVNATIDDNSCEYTTCAGCTDVAACNYDDQAIINDPVQCCYDNCIGLLMNDDFGDGWDGATATVIDLSTGLIVGTAGLPDGSFGTANFCLADGCYSIVVGGGTFDGEISWTLTGITGGVLNGDANDPDGIGFSVGGVNCVPGCTEPVACNYDPTATISDCTLCDFSSCSGCTYAEATNFNPDAVIDDNSCEFPESTSDCPSDFDGNGSTGVSDLIIFIEHYGELCPW